MDKWSDTVKNAVKKGILLDWCGNDKRYYWNGVYTDFCGFDPDTEKCWCGYAKDQGGGGDTGSGGTTIELYYGTVDYSANTSIDSVTDDEIAAMTQLTGTSCTYVITPTAVDGLDTDPKLDLDALEKQYAKTLLIAVKPSSTNLVIQDSVGGDVTDQWTAKTVTISGTAYKVYGSFDYTGQVILYDSAAANPGESELDYKLSH